MRNISEKNVDRIKTHVLYSLIVLHVNRVVYEIMCENTVQPYRPQTIL
jgi:hypothetical protein